MTKWLGKHFPDIYQTYTRHITWCVIYQVYIEICMRCRTSGHIPGIYHEYPTSTDSRWIIPIILIILCFHWHLRSAELGLADHVWPNKRVAIAQEVDGLGAQFRPALRDGWQIHQGHICCPALGGGSWPIHCTGEGGRGRWLRMIPCFCSIQRMMTWFCAASGKLGGGFPQWTLTRNVDFVLRIMGILAKKIRIIVE